MKRVTFTIEDAQARLLKRFAKAHRITERDALRLAVWAYLLPLAPSLKPPVGPLPTLTAIDELPASPKRRT